ncbi:rhomboid family intramembrane serine protease [Pseudaminobacter soli (ex Li et al. 2025)]|uniref:Rhomboid family intramembrane serine protease n=1 Tax=Pseudaminobacter soli (ex Li et al. 2025) TaxID=1295366 RepID=A0A2P7SAC4_9HYPH|nr:rhomboid family intramembrane serine protease [Mesorhizobium soli]PSJ59449.1 rhomboid family intramembrane serine protease [Mesorhizobium soli]
MFIPLYDSNHLRHIKHQYVTIGLIAANVIIFFLTSSSDEYTMQARALGLGYVPSVAFDRATLPAELVLIPSLLTYVTYAFLHNDIWHLGGNMLFLWVFGDNVEDALGYWRYLLFYLLCAIAGALAHGLLMPDSQQPLIGASGAIAGIVTAYLILYPRVKVWILAFGRIPLHIPAYMALGLWILFQLFMLLFGETDQISWACHAGGIVAGALLVLVLRSRDVPLFEQEEPAAQPAESAPAEPAPAADDGPSPWGPRR